MKKIYYWGPAVFWAMLIFYMSAQKAITTSDVKLIDFLVHKTAHLFEYSFLTLLFYRAVNKGLFKKGNWKIPLALTIIYALTDELHQLFVVTREGKLRDVAIDTFGGCIGLWVQKYLQQIQMLKRKN